MRRINWGWLLDTGPGALLLWCLITGCWVGVLLMIDR